MLYILNQKSNFTKEEIIAYQNIVREFPYKENVVFAPSTCFLPFFEGLSLAAQDVSPYKRGAHTGDVNAESLASLGVSYVLVGHSERRSDWKEEETLIKKKIEQVLNASMTPVLCIGETKEEYEDLKTKEVLEQELSIFSSFPQEVWKKIIVAYEPVWAIGTGSTLDEVSIQKMVDWMKSKVFTKVLYGGSVTMESLKKLQKIPSLDGFLIGGMSLKIEEVVKLLQES